MSRDFIVLAPNGRRQKVHCTPDTSILQVLEDVCHKQGFQPTDYDLRHHNHVLDLTTTIRFSNLPNKATLEIVEADRKRQESNVTIGLLLEDGERRTADFCPNTSLHDLLNSLAPNEYTSLDNPTILYMRQEVIGEPALRQKTLRHLGLISGRAILRLLNKAEEARQANVSTVYRCPPPASSQENTQTTSNVTSPSIRNISPNTHPSTSTADIAEPGPSDYKSAMEHKQFDPIKHIKNIKNVEQKKMEVSGTEISPDVNSLNVETPMETEDSQISSSASHSLTTQQNLERRLRIEEEVTFLGENKAIAFMLPEETEEELDDLPDDFYDLSVDEVRKLYHELQKSRLDLENSPLLTSSKREEMMKQTSKQQLNTYKNAVVRVQFPDRIILQGVFSPNDKISDVLSFVKKYLKFPEKEFHMFTSPLKETLNPDMTLFEARFVPCVHMHFKWLEGEDRPYLKEEIYSKKTTSSAANLLASKYRAPSRNLEASANSKKKTNEASSTSNSKVPKWFK